MAPWAPQPPSCDHDALAGARWQVPWLGDNRGRGVGLGLLGRQVGREILEPSQRGRDPGKAYRAGGGERPATVMPTILAGQKTLCHQPGPTPSQCALMPRLASG
jgi:hypothetical protein